MSELSDTSNHSDDLHDDKEKLLLDMSPISEDDLKEDNLTSELEGKDEIKFRNANDGLGSGNKNPSSAEPNLDDNGLHSNDGQNNDSDGMFSDWSDDGDEILQNIEQVHSNYLIYWHIFRAFLKKFS